MEDMGDYGCGVRDWTATGTVILWNNFTVDVSYPDYAYYDEEPPPKPPSIVTYTEDELVEGQLTENDADEKGDEKKVAGVAVQATRWPLPEPDPSVAAAAGPVNNDPASYDHVDDDELVPEVDPVKKQGRKKTKKQGKDDEKNAVEPSPAPLKKVMIISKEGTLADCAKLI
jgi:hypothetical protein